MSPSGIHLTRKLFTLNLSVLNFKTNYGKRICLCVPTDRDMTILGAYKMCMFLDCDNEPENKQRDWRI